MQCIDAEIIKLEKELNIIERSVSTIEVNYHGLLVNAYSIILSCIATRSIGIQKEISEREIV